MKKICSALLSCLMVCLLLLPLVTETAEASDYDYIESYDITVQPQTEDGSLLITAAFEWTALEELPYGQELKIGIPNGSIRDKTILTDNIESLDNDNSFMYVYLTQEYDAGETFRFAYSWVQEYMYTLSDDGAVSYDYTPGWFDEIRVGHMGVTWQNPGSLTPSDFYVDSSADWNRTDGNATVITADDLDHGQAIHLNVSYADWPVALSPDNSSENLPDEDYGDWEDGYWEDGYYYEDSGSDMMALVFFIIIVVVVLMVLSAARRDGYAGGFGTRYVYVNHLWYPMGPDGRPRPGSTGTKHRPQPPRTGGGGGHGGGFGGGSRGGGFGGGGFGGGSHCACASSCACACACACAGGGRAGCSAKNLYGAVQLNEKLTENLTQQ
ncbi:MAG: hypothetical protein KBS74_02690 [Clostridiales bacterium]|nr:hypothetical protein [Candidatus Cacconaster stercorequi]